MTHPAPTLPPNYTCRDILRCFIYADESNDEVLYALALESAYLMIDRGPPPEAAIEPTADHVPAQLEQRDQAAVSSDHPGKRPAPR